MNRNAPIFPAKITLGKLIGGKIEAGFIHHVLGFKPGAGIKLSHVKIELKSGSGGIYFSTIEMIIAGVICRGNIPIIILSECMRAK